jgi:hypothetical protein
MIHRLTELRESNPGEEHAGGAQSYATELKAAKREPKHANKRKHSDGVGDRLSPMQVEDPAHPQITGAQQQGKC